MVVVDWMLVEETQDDHHHNKDISIKDDRVLTHSDEARTVVMRWNEKIFVMGTTCAGSAMKRRAIVDSIICDPEVPAKLARRF